MGVYEELAQIDDEASEPQESTGPTSDTGASKKKRRQVKSRRHAPRHASRHDVTSDLVTLPLGEINLRGWRIGLENNETHNSALRLTSAERDRVEDLVRELWRRHKVRSSMNEVARLGLKVIERDFRLTGQRSLVYRIKRS